MIQRDGRLTLYNTGDHRIFGMSQQQGAGSQSPTFSSDMGDLRLADLTTVDAGAPAHAAPLRNASPAEPNDGDPLTMIERLAGLHQKGILTDAEFSAKKAELLARL